MRLMILGGGSSQLGAFRRARELGITTILADRDPNAPARAPADEFVPASTFDIDAVVDAARMTRAEAIIALGTDQPVLTAAVASARLGLPFPLTPERALSVTNKRVMKQIFDDEGIPTPRWCLIGPDRTEWERRGFFRLRPPYVVKPVDSQGQRGIIIANTPDEVAAQYPVTRSYSREEEILVEEYFPSREVTVSGWAYSPDEVEIWTVTDRVTIDNPPGLGVCLAHRYPSYHAGSHLPRIEELTHRIVRSFRLGGGPIYFQMLVGAEGQARTRLPAGTEEPSVVPAGTEVPPRQELSGETPPGDGSGEERIGIIQPVLVNEIAFRLGGAYEDQSIPPVTGVDLLARQLSAARNGFSVAAPEAGARGGAVPEYTHFAVPLIFARPGTVARLSGAEELLTLPGITDCRFILPEGTVIREMTNSTQRIAYAVLHGTSAEEINTLVDTVFDTLRVENPDGENLLLDTRDGTKHPVPPGSQGVAYR
ncbi:MAG: hypothetical protein ACLFR8_06740 [Alkalispirochaeta sp.]